MSEEPQTRKSEDVDIEQVQGLLRAVQKSLGGAQDKYNLLEDAFKKQEEELKSTKDENAKLKKKVSKLSSEEEKTEKVAPFRPSRVIAASKEDEGVGWMEEIYVKNKERALPRLIKGKNKSSFAYCVLVMDRDNYSLGAAVLAHRLKKLKTKADRVCMVTKDVSVGAVEALASVFDAVFQVPYLEYPCRKMTTKKQQNYYGHWIERSFTKWNVLALSMYSKVLFMDADMLPVTNVDHLFEMKAPAATFSSPWAFPYRDVGYKDPYKGLKNGDPVPASMIKEAIKLSLDSSQNPEKMEMKGSYVGLGSLVLLEPSLSTYGVFTAFVQTQLPFGIPGCHSGFDEQSIVLFYYLQHPLCQWTHISQEYNALSWHESWLDGLRIKCYHYFNNKPWMMRPDAYSDLKYWYQAANEFGNDNPSHAGYLMEVCLSDPHFMELYQELKTEEGVELRRQVQTEESETNEERILETSHTTKKKSKTIRTLKTSSSSSSLLEPPHSPVKNTDVRMTSNGSGNVKKPAWFEECDERGVRRLSSSSSVTRDSSPVPRFEDHSSSSVKYYSSSSKHKHSSHRMDVTSYGRQESSFLGRRSYAGVRHNSERWNDRGGGKLRPYVDPALRELRRQQVMSSSPAAASRHLQRQFESFGSSNSGASYTSNGLGGRSSTRLDRPYHNP